MPRKRYVETERRSQSAKHNDAHKESESEHAPAAQVENRPHYSPSLLRDGKLNGRGNGSVRAAMMQDAQQTQGNRALQRMLRGQVSIQRRTDFVDFDPDEGGGGGGGVATATPTSGGASAGGILRQGSSGPAVSTLQQLLNAAGVTPTVGTDGVFGAKTHSAVVNFQQSKGLSADGVAGPKTFGALKNGVTGGAVTAPGPGPAAPDDGKKVSFTLGSETPLEEAKKDFEAGLAAADSGDAATALPFFRRIYSLPEIPNKGRLSALFNMGAALRKLGESQKAIDIFQEVLVFPDLQAKFNLRAKALENIRQLRAQLAGAPADATPDNVTPDQKAQADTQVTQLNAASDAAGQAGDFKAAFDNAQKAYFIGAASSTLRGGALSRMGVASRRLGQFDKAIEFFEELLSFPGIDDQTRNATLERIRQARLKNSGAASSITVPALSLDEQKAKFASGSANIDNGQYAAALADFTAIYNQPDAGSRVRRRSAFNMGFCHQRLLEFDKAISLFEEVLEFPEVPADERDKAIEKLRQSRMGEVGKHLTANDPTPSGSRRGEFSLFTGELFFKTGSLELDDNGIDTVSAVGAILNEKRKADPTLQPVIHVIGHASRRFASAATDEQAAEQNLKLSGQRAETAKTAIERLLDPPPADFDIDAEGDRFAREIGTDAKDNTWFLRSVTLLVDAVKVTPPAPASTGARTSNDTAAP